MPWPHQKDSRLQQILEQEKVRQESCISLIASENYASPAILQASAHLLSNKYAEGYPGKRYYAGCQYADEVELLAIERCKKLFGSEHVNVQPHAGSQANMAAYFALLKPGDTILGMGLAEGGHLTHGHQVNFSGSLYQSISYKVDRETELIDYHEIADLAYRYKPKLIIAGASSYSRIIDFKVFAEIAQSIQAYFMADIAHIAGLIATQLHPDPISWADVVTSTTHKTLRGTRGGLIMCKNNLASVIDRAIIPGTQGGPFMHAIAGKAATFFEALQPTFKEYQQDVLNNAQIMVQVLQSYGYRVVSNGTDNHMFVLDLRNQRLTGLQADKALEEVGIIVSKSCIPFDTEKPWVASGIRIGTPAMTTRGMKDIQAQELAFLIHEVLSKHTSKTDKTRVAQRIQVLCAQFPIYS